MSDEDDPAEKTDEEKVERKKFDRRSRSDIDRRSGADRREMHDLNRFVEDETERRNFSERRHSGEIRDDWVRISKWSSMYVGHNRRDDDKTDDKDDDDTEGGTS